ncbi:MAG: PRC-barrel domain-containing protein [Methanobacteriaceae archaeon]|nr:PRC-barrel domain-containing protein [Methanobacteriaceae archaeon]
MVKLSLYYNLSVYNTEGKYIGKVQDVILNIKKGKISILKTKILKTETNKNVGLRDVLKNMRFVPEDEEEVTPVTKEEGIIDIPYNIVTAIGDILLIDQNKLTQVTQQPRKVNQPTKNIQTTQKKTVPRAH